MQSVRHWTTYTSVNEKPSEPDSDSGLNLGRRVIGLYDFKVPVTVDLAARFNWFLSRKVTLFAEGRNLRLGLLPRLRRGLYRRREVAVLSGGGRCLHGAGEGVKQAVTFGSGRFYGYPDGLRCDSGRQSATERPQGQECRLPDSGCLLDMKIPHGRFHAGFSIDSPEGFTS